MLVRDWYVQKIRYPDADLDHRALAAQLEALTAEEFVADAFLCRCGAILPIVPPFITAHAHLRAHPDADLNAGLIQEFDDFAATSLVR